jgi:hypothetical protein
MSFYIEYEGDGRVHGRFQVPGSTSAEALDHARRALRGIAVRTAVLRFSPSTRAIHNEEKVVAFYTPSTDWEPKIQPCRP